MWLGFRGFRWVSENLRSARCRAGLRPRGQWRPGGKELATPQRSALLVVWWFFGGVFLFHPLEPGAFEQTSNPNHLRDVLKGVGLVNGKDKGFSSLCIERYLERLLTRDPEF